MTFRVLPDGAIETDTAEEAIQLAAAMRGAQPAPPSTRKPPPVESQWDPPSQTWYFTCACGQRRENSGIHASVSRRSCTRCGSVATSPEGHPRGPHDSGPDTGDVETELRKRVAEIKAQLKARKTIPVADVKVTLAGVELDAPASADPISVPRPTLVATLGDGDKHVTGTDCCIEIVCETCGKRRHVGQGVGISDVTLCEGCDAAAWSPPVVPSPDPSAEPDSPEWWAAFVAEHGRDPTPAEMSQAGHSREATVVGMCRACGKECVLHGRPGTALWMREPGGSLVHGKCLAAPRSQGVIGVAGVAGSEPPTGGVFAATRDTVLLCESHRQELHQYRPYDTPKGFAACEASEDCAALATSKVYLSGVMGTGVM